MRVRELVSRLSETEFLGLYQRNVKVRDEYQSNLNYMNDIIEQMKLAAADKGWEISDEG